MLPKFLKPTSLKPDTLSMLKFPTLQQQSEFIMSLSLSLSLSLNTYVEYFATYFTVFGSNLNVLK